MTDYYVCNVTHPDGGSCRHYYHWQGSRDELLADGRSRQATYIGERDGVTTGRATCTCCLDQGAALPVKDGAQCLPIPCDEAMDRCKRCLMTGGVHTVNCPSNPDPIPASDRIIRR